jgi:hypothetical protein
MARKRYKAEGTSNESRPYQKALSSFGYGPGPPAVWSGREFETAREKLLFATSCFDFLDVARSSPKDAKEDRDTL